MKRILDKIKEWESQPVSSGEFLGIWFGCMAIGIVIVAAWLVFT